MYIKNCYIENFGKLHEFNIEFVRGLNVIKEDNGWGKTTLMAFIKAMFYGMVYKPNGKEFYDRKRYMPWNGGKFGGYMVFEVDGKEYKVTRFFGTKDVQDEFELTDMSTGKISADYSEKLGEEIFGIDMDSFERSVFISGEKRASITDGINAKLNNLIENTDDIGNFENADAKLDKIIKKLNKRGGGGEIQRKTELIKELEEKCRDCDSKAGFIRSSKKHIEEYVAGRQECEASIKQIDDKIGKAEFYNKCEQYKTLKCRKTEAKNELEGLEHFFEKHKPSDEEITKSYNLVTDVGALNRAIDALGNVKKCAENEEALIDEYAENYKKAIEINNQLEEMSLKCEKLSENCKMIEEGLQTTQHGKKSIVLEIVLLVISLGIMAFGIIDTIKKFIPYGVLFIIVGAVMTIFAIAFLALKLLRNSKFVLYRDKLTVYKEIYEEDMEKIKAEAVELRKEGRAYKAKAIEFAETRLDNVTEEFIEDLARLRENYNNYTKALEYQSELLTKEENICEFLNYYDYGYNDNKSYYDKLQIIRDNLRDYNYSMKNYKELSDELDSFEAANDINKILSIEEKLPEHVDITTLQLERNKWQSEADRLSGLISRAQKTIDDTSLEVDKKQEYESEIERLKEEVKELEDKYKIFTITKDMLNEAREKLSIRYMEDMKAAFEKYLEIFEVPENIKLELGFDTRMEQNGKDWDSRYFSSGYADMTDICVRLALVDAMFKEEKPPVILDDPFVNLDDNKLVKAGKAIEALAKDKQIIYTVCSDARKPETI